MGLTITAANVVASNNSRITWGIAGMPLTQGMPVYSDAADSDKYKACNAQAEATARCDGICLTSSRNGQPVAIANRTDNTINLGATLVPGVIYATSDSSGGIRDVDDALSGEYVSTLGVAISTSLMRIDINNSGVAIA